MERETGDVRGKARVTGEEKCGRRGSLYTRHVRQNASALKCNYKMGETRDKELRKSCINQNLA
jgi:hypothetical protein